VLVRMNIQRVTWLQRPARSSPAFRARAISATAAVRRLLRTQVLLRRLPWRRRRQTDQRQRRTHWLLPSLLR